MTTAIVGGGMVGTALERCLAERGEETIVLKNIGPSDRLLLPSRLRRMIITAQARDAKSAVVTEDLAFVNAGLAVKAAAAAAAAGAEELCLFSTGSIYGSQPRPLREDDPPDTTPGPYAASKLAAEAFVRSWAPRFRRVVVLRPFAIYGPGLAATRLLARLPELARSQQKITLAGGEGLVTNPIHAIDAARCTLSLLEGAGFAVFNLGGNQIATLRAIIDLMAEALSLRPDVVVTAGSPAQFVGDIGAMRAAGAEPEIDLWDGLRAYYREGVG